MINLPWILIGVTTLILLFGLVFLFRKKKRPIDYYNLFVIGIVFLILGIPMNNSILFLLGIVFVITGLMHKGEWKKNHKSWRKMNKKEKNFFILAIIILTLLLVGGIGFLFIQNEAAIIQTNNSEINSFEECVAAGNLVMESYPRQCGSGDKTFVEEIDYVVLDELLGE